MIFEEVNRVRLKNDLPKLFFSDSLDVDAEKHVKDMQHANDNYYSNSAKKVGECNAKIFYRNDNLYVHLYRVRKSNCPKNGLDSPGHAKLILGEFFLYGASAVYLNGMEERR